MESVLNMSIPLEIISGLRSIRELDVFLLPSVWDGCPKQGYHPAINSPVQDLYYLYAWLKRRNKFVSKSTTRRSRLGSTPDRLNQSPKHS